MIPNLGGTMGNLFFIALHLIVIIFFSPVILTFTLPVHFIYSKLERGDPTNSNQSNGNPQ